MSVFAKELFCGIGLLTHSSVVQQERIPYIRSITQTQYPMRIFGNVATSHGRRRPHNLRHIGREVRAHCGGKPTPSRLIQPAGIFSHTIDRAREREIE